MRRCCRTSAAECRKPARAATSSSGIRTNAYLHPVESNPVPDGNRRHEMRAHLLKSIGASAVILSALVVLQPTEITAQNQSAAKTPWGEPDLQGIWTDETDTPLQRPAQYANQEFFTEAQREDLDKQRAAMLRRDTRRERGTEGDVSGAYNSEFLSIKRVGARTSLIVDPPNGRTPPLTPEAQKTAATDREFRLAMLQATDTCKEELPACAGG